MEIGWDGEDRNKMGLWVESDKTVERGLVLDMRSYMQLKVRLRKEIG